MLFLYLLFVVGWTVMALATNAGVLCLGRAVTGFCSAAFCLAGLVDLTYLLTYLLGVSKTKYHRDIERKRVATQSFDGNSYFVGPVYIGEVSSARVRGALSSSVRSVSVILLSFRWRLAKLRLYSCTVSW